MFTIHEFKRPSSLNSNLNAQWRSPAKGTPTLERVIQAITQWKHSDKEELLVILRAMLEAEEDEQAANEQTLKERTQHRGPKGGRGYYERKIINGGSLWIPGI